MTTIDTITEIIEPRMMLFFVAVFFLIIIDYARKNMWRKEIRMENDGRGRIAGKGRKVQKIKVERYS